MAKIRGIEGLAYDQIQMELRAGARFVEYPYCISVGFMTLRRVSDIYFIRNGRGSVSRRLGYSVISSLFGWWGIPWGPFCTIASILTSFRGGKDVTQQVLAALSQPAEPPVQVS